MFYAKSTGGFYDPDIHGEQIPKDAVEITDQEYTALIEGQSSGKIIIADESGKPILADVPPPSEDDLLKTAKATRALAYQAESDPIFFKWQRGEATEQEWLDKVAEIKTRYPDPTSR